MFKSRFIRGSDGSLKGRIDENKVDSRAYDASGKYVGRYDRRLDMTYDNSGRLVTTSGDALSSLIFGRKR
jgi:hypothetical protein